ncbi:MAG TPA: di-trans,poly-cis-decaprenylcistransferase, partial [Campylobacterales bacterium]|nr:di-trans,poly-cis-decaprenylcistransferase [Campylobacterales bacterium]
MDGNGRWAKQRGKIRTKGHEEGAKRVRDITQAAAKAGVKYLTLYAFSTENWARPKSEVEFLMKLLEKYLESEKSEYQTNGIKFEVIGDMSRFSDSLNKKISELRELTKNNKKLTQLLAINYGSKDEIVRAVKKMMDSSVELNEENLSIYLDTGDAPAVDMMVRTGGDKRLSNFLLWQSAYAELFFTDTLWPDFGEAELLSMIEEFKTRERRFG